MCDMYTLCAILNTSQQCSLSLLSDIRTVCEKYIQASHQFANCHTLYNLLQDDTKKLGTCIIMSADIVFIPQVRLITE